MAIALVLAAGLPATVAAGSEGARVLATAVEQGRYSFAGPDLDGTLRTLNEPLDDLVDSLR